MDAPLIPLRVEDAYFIAARTSFATSSMSSAFSAGNGRFMSSSSSTVLPPTVTTKAPLRGFSLLTSTVTPGRAFASLFALVLNAPQLRGTSRVNGVDAASMAYELKKDAGRRPLAGLDLDDGAAAGRLGRRFGLGSRGLLGRRFRLGFLRHGCVSDGFAASPRARNSVKTAPAFGRAWQP